MPDPLKQVLLNRPQPDQAPLDELKRRLLQIWSDAKNLLPLDPHDNEEFARAGLPTPGRPPQYQPQPEVVGTELGRLVDKAIKFAPSLQGYVGKAQFGPGKPTMEYLNSLTKPAEMKLRHEDFGNQNAARFPLLGVTQLSTGDMNINPSLPRRRGDSEGLQSVLGHELTHARGYSNEIHPEEVAAIIAALGGIPSR